MSSETLSLPLPEGTRLLHIGAMKTGTTLLQRAASSQREQLLEHNVLYPGRGVNQRRAVSGAFLRQRVIRKARRGAIGQSTPKTQNDPAIPPKKEWNALLNEVQSNSQRRILISDENIAGASDTQAQQLIDAIGNKVHIVLSLRNLSTVLPSFWAQTLTTSAFTDRFDYWLGRALDDNPDKPISAVFRRNLDQAGLLERWSSIVGPENMTVIIADRHKPKILTDAFERMLDLPQGLITEFPNHGLTSNRSLRLPETELILRINELSSEHTVDWNTYTKLVKDGVVRRLKARTPGPDEPRVQLPQWAFERCHRLGKEHAARINASGVHVIGDPSSLYTTAAVTDTPDTELNTVPMVVASEALAGMLSASMDRGAFFAKPKQPQTPAQPNLPAGQTQNTDAKQTNARPSAPAVASSHTTRELASALRIRLSHKIRTGRSKPLKKQK